MQTFITHKNLIRNALITIYILIVLGISATARAEMRILPIFTGHEQVASQSYIGQVAMTVDGDFYLLVSQNEFYELKSNIDLSDFVGLTVQVEAYEIKHKVGPVVQTASLDPLPGSSAKATAAPLLLVLGISELTE